MSEQEILIISAILMELEAISVKCLGYCWTKLATDVVWRQCQALL